jgi:hypothetical protein
MIGIAVHEQYDSFNKFAQIQKHSTKSTIGDYNLEFGSVSKKYVQKRSKPRADWDEHLTRSKKQFGSSFATSLSKL